MLTKGSHIAALAQFELVSAMETNLARELISGDEGAAAARFNVPRDTVDTTLDVSVPPGYRRTAPIKRPTLDGDKTVQRCLRTHLPKQ